MPTDHELLDEYARSRSETAFALIVQRYLILVYSVALRRTRDPELARDASQIVFVDLARKAGRLRSGLVLSAWLHRAAVFAASRLVRAERRRAQREEAIMSEEPCSTAEASWDDIAPLLDEAVHNLSEPDRQAVLLRFFENKTHQDVARALGVSEEAARKRTDRALERLRVWLTRRGVRTSVAGLTTLVSAHAVQGAPAGLGAALASSAAGSAGSVSLFTQLVHAMTTTQIKGGLAAVAMAGLAVPLVLQHQTIAGLKTENHALERYVFVEHPSEYRENLMAWDLANVDGDWKIFRKRPFFGIDPEEHPHLHRAQPGPL
jgi:RNA polymerase sigma factor (sigma-70 family)